MFFTCVCPLYLNKVNQVSLKIELCKINKPPLIALYDKEND